MRRLLLVIALSCFATPAAFADGAGQEQSQSEADVEKAQAVLKQYLDTLVKAAEGRKPKPAEVSKKLTAARKFIHPKTLELVAQQEKNKVVANAMAVWYWARNDYWLRHYEITEAKPVDETTKATVRSMFAAAKAAKAAKGRARAPEPEPIDDTPF